MSSKASPIVRPANEWLLDRLATEEVVAVHAEEFPEAFQPILKSEAIFSILLTPIRAGGDLWGLVGFDERRRAREWSEAEIGALRIAASLLGAAVERAAAESDRDASRERLWQAARMEALGWLASGEAPPKRSPLGEERVASDHPATILLVEDEDIIRHLAEQILSAAGYRVIAAANASEAMVLAEELGASMDLLLTDVVMPGASGADLAHGLLRRHPEMRILYMSGYSDSLIFRYGVTQERAAFLRKPFSAELLERRVAELLAPEAST